MIAWTLPRESVEWVGPVTVTGGGTVALALIPVDTRPAPLDWKVPTTLNGGIGVLLDGTLTPGVYRLWARVSGNPEVAIFDDVADVYIT